VAKGTVIDARNTNPGALMEVSVPSKPDKYRMYLAGQGDPKTALTEPSQDLVGWSGARGTDINVRSAQPQPVAKADDE
jgi:hypothetical protein